MKSGNDEISLLHKELRDSKGIIPLKEFSKSLHIVSTLQMQVCIIIINTFAIYMAI